MGDGAKPWIVPIPGTMNRLHIEENDGAAAVKVNPEELKEIRTALSAITVEGARTHTGIRHAKAGCIYRRYISTGNSRTRFIWTPADRRGGGCASVSCALRVPPACSYVSLRGFRADLADREEVENSVSSLFSTSSSGPNPTLSAIPSH